MHSAARALKRDGIDPAADKQAKKPGVQEAEQAEQVAGAASAMPTFAERALQKMKQILRFAEAKGYIGRNPLADTSGR
jgi:hypothetical protein